MVQRGENFGFTLKSADAIGILRELSRQDLDGNFTLQLQVTSAIHLTHAAFAEHPGDFMRAKLCADGQCHDFACDYRTLEGQWPYTRIAVEVARHCTTWGAALDSNLAHPLSRAIPNA